MENQNPKILSDNTDGSRRISPSNSPEFEFCMSTNPSSQQPTLHSADELFAGGILLPLHHLNIQSQTSDDPPPTNTPSINPNLDHAQRSDLKSTFTSSKRWKNIFKKNPEIIEKEKKNKAKNGFSGGGVAGGEGGVAAGGGGMSTAELNINIWPFSRSRSAGNGGSRPRTVVGNRKVSSAPCSRSNSTGDKYRKWPSSPGRVGVHLGRSSPVWQAKRVGQSRSIHDSLVRSSAGKDSRPAKSSTSGAGANGKVLNVNVPTCIGYRHRMSCRSDVVKGDNTGRVAGGNDDVTPVSTGGEVGASSLFNLRSLFTKKVF